MSRKSKRNRPPEAPRAPETVPTPARRMSRGALFVAAAMALLLAFVVATLLYKSEKVESSQRAATDNRPALASSHSPSLGNPQARVHIVEFLDPACETCAAFYPHVKRLMAAHPDRIRLSVRHVGFHQGAQDVVRILEASRTQGKYWQALETLLANQDRWTAHHSVVMDQVWPSLAAAGLDLDRARADMSAAEVSKRIEQDMADARALGVSKTPEFFVNGRPMPSFGLEQLQDLVTEEIRRAYP